MQTKAQPTAWRPETLSLGALPLTSIHLGAHLPPRLRAGHPWVYRTEIASSAPQVTDRPAIAEVFWGRDRFAGRGILNPSSVLTVRLLTRRRGQQLDGDFVRGRVLDALEQRRQYLQDHDPETSCCRLVYAEGDGLPGLIIDKLGPVLAFQSLAVASEVCLEPALAAVRDIIRPRWVVERNDAAVRALEGLVERRGPWPPDSAGPPDSVEIWEGPLRFLVSPLTGQKTGFFLDQRDNRRMVAELCARARARLGRPVDVLDCFCYTGGFAVAAARGAGPGGLRRLVMVDSSEPALEMARANVQLNAPGLAPELLQSNAFDVLREMQRGDGGGANRAGFDVIVLDPPPFARERRMLEGALRGYKEINLRAVRLLRPGGVLVTCTCSHHVSRELFLDVLRDAAADAGVTLRLAAATGHPPDHPVLLGHPEGDYLRCFVLEKAAE
jgi:23S rRNA (cytosine1962-C5)-methyltransferase